MYINVADIGADALNDIPLSEPTQEAASVSVTHSESPRKGVLFV